MTDLFETINGGEESQGAYRYVLWRRLSNDKRRVLFVMLNPSTADAENDDPTIRRCKSFARAFWNAGILAVVNLFAWRATDPAELWAAGERGEDIVGPNNDRVIRREANAADTIVFAWGAGAPTWRADKVVGDIRGFKRFVAPMLALAETKEGAPRHPLYVPSECTPLPWPSGAPR